MQKVLGSIPGDAFFFSPPFFFLLFFFFSPSFFFLLPFFLSSLFSLLFMLAPPLQCSNIILVLVLVVGFA